MGRILIRLLTATTAIIVAACGVARAQSPAQAAVAPSATPPVVSSPDDPVRLLEVMEWRAHAAGSGAHRICYVAHTPLALQARQKRDIRPMLYVTHRPHRQSWDSVAFASAYAFRRDSIVRLEFENGPSFRLFTDGEFAWATDEATDRRIIAALGERDWVAISGLSRDGEMHSDRLDLRGFAAVFQRASSECRRPGLPLKR